MKNIFCLLVLVSSSVFAEVVILHEKKEDLNKDGKMDSIAWVANSKEARRPSRLVIRVPGKILLDLSGNFCAPGEKSPDCTPLSVKKRLSPRKEPLLVFENGSSTYIYRWQNGSYGPYRASWMTKEERHEINYSNNQSLVTLGKTTETCPLKNSRSQEDLSQFTLFEIRNEADCPKPKK